MKDIIFLAFLEKLLGEVKQWLGGKSSKSVDLKQLARVEESVLDRYKGFTTFRDLGHGSFIQFLSEHKELEALISISVQSDNNVLGIKKSDVIDLLQQCGVNSEKVNLTISFVNIVSHTMLIFLTDRTGYFCFRKK